MLSFLLHVPFEGVEGAIPELADFLEVRDQLRDGPTARGGQLVDLLTAEFLGPDEARLLE